MNRSRLLIFVVVGMLVTTAASAMQLYRYKDDNGNTVMAALIPPHLVSKGYDILNAQGRLVQRIPPALTEEQIRERDEAAEKKKQEELAAAKQAEEDQKLLKQYGTPDAVVSIMNRRLAEIDAVIVSRKAAIEASKNLITKSEEQAANIQRSGKKVGKRILDDIEMAKKEIAVSQSVIEQSQASYQQILSEFTVVVNRLEVLTGTKAKDFPIER